MSERTQSRDARLSRDGGGGEPVPARVPKTLRDELDELVDEGHIESRSQAVREALRQYLLHFDHSNANGMGSDR